MGALNRKYGCRSAVRLSCAGEVKEGMESAELGDGSGAGMMAKIIAEV